MLTDQDPQVCKRGKKMSSFPFFVLFLSSKLINSTALLNHFHVELARSIHCAAAHASVRFPWHILDLNVVLSVALASAPKEEQHQAKQDDTEKRDETHCGRDDQRLYIKGERDIGSCTVSTSFGGLVGDEGERLVGLVWPVRRVAMDVQVSERGVIAACVACYTHIGTIVLNLGIAHLKGTVWQHREPSNCLGGDELFLRG